MSSLTVSLKSGSWPTSSSASADARSREDGTQIADAEAAREARVGFQPVGQLEAVRDDPGGLHGASQRTREDGVGGDADDGETVGDVRDRRRARRR